MYSKMPATKPKKEDTADVANTPDAAKTPKRAAEPNVKTIKDANDSVNADAGSVVEVDRAKSQGYILRLDLFLVPKNLADENLIVYSNRRIKLKGNSSYNHDQILLTILAQSTPASDKASAAKITPQADSFIPGSYFHHDFFNDKDALAKIDAIFSSADMSGNLFAEWEACFAKVDEIHADYLKSIDKH
ncbi:hypothetical protein H4S07_003671 [Coemansia furcata]|uniref:Uncharacterized protein n=1 Tax=Coemansia furcata TaxID=417177 RepID=A0ACC1LG20_9FUNG|nr:hypothetical protein H4S07_003671 [Coemansia furcata]